MSGTLIIVSAPSGTGKTTVLKRVMADIDRLVFSVSHTTRKPRPGEQDGRDYYFVDRERFKDMIDADEFLEWAEVHGNLYGTAVAPVSRQLAEELDVILDIDVQGAGIIREAHRFPAVHVFIAPPGPQELEVRLRGRGTEDEKTIQRRLHNAVSEMAQSGLYDYMVVNDRLEDAVSLMKSIIFAERARARHTCQGLPISGGEQWLSGR